ncbi:carboxymuconolactone decarboxylase family protein [Autumnicola edwardsiae]|jgi:AhpD family alkylhydroperoxidase|uniref:Carboxymuconolactone decarboxylase family protein n=1 Tax=Autumnicola edwardsiae TaxID=3075594 RepID=A0ABU3CSK9_9FLAO|nr:carboxymuconolactone decarboxylase family protein [Zunongwangia sp. F297]MDT0648880.1 carboxymuconolactone decarboxylase family protein [Zunongwangia sp. F297]
MANKVEDFNIYRQQMNDKILNENNKVLKRIFNLDTNAFTEGVLDKKTKELLGLVASVVLRCDDCVKYHLESSYKQGVAREEVMETLSIGTLIGGTIVIPHLRRAFEYWEALEETKEG